MYNFRIQDAIANCPAKTLTGRLIAPNAPTPTAQSITEDICETVRKFYYSHETLCMNDKTLGAILDELAAEIENGVCAPEGNNYAPTIEIVINDEGTVYNTTLCELLPRPCQTDRVYFFMDADYYVCNEEAAR